MYQLEFHKTYENNLSHRPKSSKPEVVQKKSVSVSPFLKSNQPNLFEQKESRKNLTGLPNKLKAGIESLSGFCMDDVRVHYNSSKPAQFQALAYTQGTDIYVASSQEKYLPHEAWHVVQQKQGRVLPTAKIKGVNINDNDALEREADSMGSKVTQLKAAPVFNKKSSPCKNKVIQRTYRKEENGKWITYSSFDKFNHKLQSEEDGRGDGGALTIFCTSADSLFSHRILALEWHDGTNNEEKNLVVHLDTPELHEDPNRIKQISSFLPWVNMKSKVEELPNWNLERSSDKPHRTKELTEAEKEEKRREIEAEIGKEYTYSVTGKGLFQEAYNCATWAEKVAGFTV